MSGEHNHQDLASKAELAAVAAASAADIATLTVRVDDLEARLDVLEGLEPEPGPEPEPEPPIGNRAKAALGVYPGNWAQNPLTNLERYEDELGRKVRFVIANLGDASWKDLTGSSYAHFGPNGWQKRPDVKLCMTLPLRTKTDVGTIAADLRAVANGNHDADYRLVGQRAVDAGCTDVIWRIGHEADSPTSYPWSFTATGAHVEYIAAWRHVALLLRGMSGEFRFDYQGAGQWEKINKITGKTNAETGYPGGDVVDYIGVDKYNRTVYQPWEKMVLALDYNRDLAVRKLKQMSIPEWGLRIDETGDDPAFIAHFADWLEAAPATGPGSLAYHGYFWAWEHANLDNAPRSKAVYLERFR